MYMCRQLAHAWASEFAGILTCVRRKLKSCRDDDPCALLSHEGASATVQSAPSDSAPSDSTPAAKLLLWSRFLKPANSKLGPSNLFLPRCFEHIITQSLDTQVHNSTVTIEDLTFNLTQRLQSLELNVSGVHVKLQAHDDKLDRLNGQV